MRTTSSKTTIETNEYEVLIMGSKPAREDKIPSAGVNWKLFLLVAGIIGIALAAFTLLPSGEENGTPATDIDGTGTDVVGQGSGSNSPATAVETETPAETETPNKETDDRINSFWYEMGAKPTPTEVEIQYLDYLDYAPEDIGAFNKGYYPTSTKVFGHVAIHGLYGKNAIEVIPVGSVILSDMKVSEAKMEFYIENTEEYAKTVSPFIISIEVETVDATGEVIEIPLSLIYRTEKIRLESGEKEKVVIGEDLIRSFITKGYPLKIVGIRVDTR